MISITNKIIFIFSLLLLFFSAAGQSIPEIINEYNKTTDANQKVSLLVKLGLNYQSMNAYRKALDYYTEALEIYKDNKFYTEKTFIMQNAALCYEELREYKSALALWKDILKEKRQLKERREVIVALEKIANLSVLDNNYKEAIDYSLLLLPEYGAIENKAGIASVYNNLGSFYKKKGDTRRSEEFFDRCRQMIDQADSGINQNDLADILLNIGLTHTVSGEIVEANQYMQRALQIREKQNKNVEVANILNYMAATDLIGEYYNPAKAKIDKALSILEHGKDEPRYDEVLIASYRIYCELLLRKKKIKEFKYYNDLYNKSKDLLIEKEQKQNVVVLQQQMEIEKKESELRLIQVEKDRQESEFRQSELEKEKKQKELIIQSKEIELLKQSRDLQLVRIRNQELDKQRIGQLLELSKQRAASLEQQREIDALEKNKEFQRLTIEKQYRENKLLELEKKVREQKFAEESVKRKYIMGLVGLLLVVVVGTFYFLWQQKKNNAMLGAQNDVIKMNNQKITQQNNELSQVNEELYQVNEELNVHRDNLEMQNKEMERAKHIIASQNEELKAYNSNLESMVNNRTEELNKSNQRLILNNRQLEQFGYVVSHNLRGPIARLLGLASIVNKKAIDDENNMLLDKIVEVTTDLDLIIHDLNQVLEVQKGIEQELSVIRFDEMMEKIILRLENKIEERKAEIETDFAAKEIKCIKPYLESVLYNLMSNAIKYSKPGTIPKIKLTTEISGEYIVMKISDNGIGIDIERFKDKLFGLYKRFHTHVDGKGLGLYMVKTQLEAMGGSIKVESKPNVGSTFTVYFKQ